MKKISVILIIVLLAIVGCQAKDTPTGNNYKSEEISVGYDKKLRGTLLNAGERAPLIILLPGSGPQDQDENILGNKPLKDIAEGLAARGISSVRYDKRTFTYPQDFLQDATIENEYYKDLEWVMSELAHKLKPMNIFILGHSQGGIVLPYFAATHESELSGLVFLATSPRKMVDILEEQLKNQPQANLQEIESLITKLRNQEENPLLPVEYLKSLDKVEDVKYLEKIKLPLLFLQGEADFQVSPDRDFKVLKEMFGDRDNAKFILYTGLNHLFIAGNHQGTPEDYRVPGNVDQQVIDDIAEFILSRKN